MLCCLSARQGAAGWVRWYLAHGLVLIFCVLSDYYCLEDYKPIGNTLLKDGTPTVSGLTAGQVARSCSTYCDRNPSCASFYAAVNASTKCQLMSVTNADLSSVFANSSQAGDIKYPLVRALLAEGNDDLRTLSYLCFKRVEDWDLLGWTTYQTFIQGSDKNGEMNGPELGWGNCQYHRTRAAGNHGADLSNGHAVLAASFGGAVLQQLLGCKASSKAHQQQDALFVFVDQAVSTEEASASDVCFTHSRTTPYTTESAYPLVTADAQS